MSVAIVKALRAAMKAAGEIDMTDPKVQAALKTLYNDKATGRVMGPIYDQLRRGEHAAGRNRLNARFQRIGPRTSLWTAGPFRFRADPNVPDLGITNRQLP
ncbi:hypothetical protein BAJUN_01400 [Bajunvirus bajun]|uniref:Uncharacterized protein n=1 Tax=Brevundimonas phage vB_BgoS-Bajun TaxID=2948594 RepID=A0A9E7N6A9_9CAUD|nr:hypothetical protein BAJUN_01400 [Brevundimonas phage vB_BgoS-Bajun]